MPISPLDEIRTRAGEEIGTSSWLTVDQARIDAFAEATEDRQFIALCCHDGSVAVYGADWTPLCNTFGAPHPLAFPLSRCICAAGGVASL